MGTPAIPPAKTPMEQPPLLPPPRQLGSAATITPNSSTSATGATSAPIKAVLKTSHAVPGRAFAGGDGGDAGSTESLIAIADLQPLSALHPLEQELVRSGGRHSTSSSKMGSVAKLRTVEITIMPATSAGSRR